jgi:hypothetical protein
MAVSMLAIFSRFTAFPKLAALQPLLQNTAVCLQDHVSIAAASYLHI